MDGEINKPSTARLGPCHIAIMEQNFFVVTECKTFCPDVDFRLAAWFYFPAERKLSRVRKCVAIVGHRTAKSLLAFGAMQLDGDI